MYSFDIYLFARLQWNSYLIFELSDGEVLPNYGPVAKVLQSSNEEICDFVSWMHEKGIFEIGSEYDQ